MHTLLDEVLIFSSLTQHRRIHVAKQPYPKQETQRANDHASGMFRLSGDKLSQRGDVASASNAQKVGNWILTIHAPSSQLQTILHAVT